MERIEVFGRTGSFLGFPPGLTYRSFKSPASLEHPDGEPVALPSLPLQGSNPIAYYVEHIRNHAPITGLLSGKLNVEVVEILDAARKSIKTGRVVSMPAN